MKEVIGKYNTAKVFTDIIEDIVSNIGDTVEVIKTIKPIYHFKASE